LSFLGEDIKEQAMEKGQEVYISNVADSHHNPARLNTKATVVKYLGNIVVVENNGDLLGFFPDQLQPAVTAESIMQRFEANN
jgi:hypothetical protein